MGYEMFVFCVVIVNIYIKNDLLLNFVWDESKFKLFVFENFFWLRLVKLVMDF